MRYELCAVIPVNSTAVAYALVGFLSSRYSGPPGEPWIVFTHFKQELGKVQSEVHALAREDLVKDRQVGTMLAEIRGAMEGFVEASALK